MQRRCMANARGLTKSLLIAVASAAAGVSYAAGSGTESDPSVVPSVWNIAPITEGAWTETFEADAGGGVAEGKWYKAGSNKIVAHSTIEEKDEYSGIRHATAVPSTRHNDWFGYGTANSKALELDTEGDAIANHLTSSDLSNATEKYVATAADKPVYVDMMVRFDPLVDAPEEFTGAKMALYINSDGQMVVVYGADGKSKAISTAEFDTKTWYRVTIVLKGDKFSVRVNDSAADFTANGETVSEFACIGSSTNLKSTSFSGTGHLDDLYVSYGDPTWQEGASKAVKFTLAGATGFNGTLSDAQVTDVNKWAADEDYTGTSPVAALYAYLVGDKSLTDAADFNFYIDAIDIDAASSKVKVEITAKGLTSGSKLQNGAKVKLLGAAANNPSNFDTVVADARELTFSDDGKATVEFSVNDQCAIFKPVIEF